MKKVSVVSLCTDHVSSSEAIDHGLCELNGGRNPSKLITVNINQRQTFVLSCFNAQEKEGKRSDIEYFVMDEQLDVLYITETWLRCQGDEAKCVGMTPPGYSMRSFPRSTTERLTFIVRDAGFDHATVTASSPFSHSSFELAHLTVNSFKFSSSACIDLYKAKKKQTN